ncbi:MAG: bifunctional DNA primase/polymerase [Kiloniellales bacterium]|nr:bifunctional DNA primase/polymerase [Kiloniellales bacterium]
MKIADTRLDRALCLAEAGFLIFPLRPGSKLPCEGESWKQIATTDRERIRRWFEDREGMNYGVCPGDGGVILDPDIKHRKDGLNDLVRLQLDHDELPDTFKVKTPSGGEHWYFTSPHPVSNSRGKLPDSIDVRGFGGYVVGPGSELIEGLCGHGDTPGGYTVISCSAIQPAPDWLLGQLRTGRQKTGNGHDPAFELDSPAAIKRGMQILRHRDPAIEGNGGDLHTYTTVCLLKDAGVSEAKAVELMIEPYSLEGETESQSWNDRCEPPWDVEGPDSLAQKAENAFRYGYNRPGARGGSPEEVFGEGPKDPDDSPLTAAELVRASFPRAEQLWRGFLLKDHLNLLHGDGGVGKTLLGLQIAVAVAAGLPLFNCQTIQMPALLVLCEDDFGETQHRLQEICDHLGVNLADLPLHVWCRPGGDSVLATLDDFGGWTAGNFYRSLKRELQRIGACLCLLDTIVDIAVLDENRRQPVNALCKGVLGRLMRDTGCTLLGTRHPSKRSMEDGTHYAGSTAWNNSVRSRLTLEAASKGSKRTLRVDKSNYGLDGELNLWMTNGVFEMEGAALQMERTRVELDAVLGAVKDLREKGITIIKHHGNGHSPADLVQYLKDQYELTLEKRTVLEHLNALQRAGKLQWVPSTSGRNARPATYEVVEEFGLEEIEIGGTKGGTETGTEMEGAGTV